MKKNLLPSLFALSALLSQAEAAFAENMVMINGKRFLCEGSLRVTDSDATCDGKPIEAVDASKPAVPGAAPELCEGSRVVPHPRGGGWVDVRASVDQTAFVGKGAVLCGSVKVGATADIQPGAKLDGAITVGKGAVIGKKSSIVGAGKIGDKVKIGENVAIAGQMDLVGADVANGTHLAGKIRMKNVKLSGNFVCSGDGMLESGPGLPAGAGL